MRRIVAIAVALAGMMFLASRAQETKRPVTPEELIALTRLSGQELSPDGTMALYGASRTDYPASDKPVGHLYLVPAAGGAARQMTTSEAGESAPAWAPDGRSFAFVSRRNGSPQLFVMPVDGGEALQVGKLSVTPSAPKWSPDGKALAFLAVPEATAEEKAEEARTGGVELMEKPHEMSQLFTLSVPGGKLAQVTPGKYHVVEFNWAPDSKRFALVAAPTQVPYEAANELSVRMVDLAGKELALLTPRAGIIQGAPEISPDGTRVAWRYPTEGISFMNGVAVCGTDGKGLVNAAAKLDDQIQQIAWAADGKALLLLTYEGTRGLLRKLDLATGEAPALFAPAGVIGAFRTDRGRTKLLFSYTDPQRPPNPWIVGADGTGARQLVDLNPQVDQWLLPAVEKFSFPSAPGVTIEALLRRTPKPPAKGIAPLAVMPHGGPDWMDQEGFDTWALYMTGQGYNVLQVNFRGSLAYGLTFYAANRGQEGFVDYDDILAGVDHLVKTGQADPQRLVIGGWSYGGCMTEWAITQTDRFKAAVVGAGVADYVSNYAQSDINHGAAGDWEFLGNPYDNPENYTKGSAVFHIRSVKTPVLILHGMEDSRVPYPQGLELYRALKTTGKSVEMVSYPGEEHSFRKPQHRVDVLKRWVEFYDRALGIVRPAEAKPAEKDGAKKP